jgi:hypothetical protein
VTQGKNKIGKWSACIKSWDGYPPFVKWGIGAFFLSVVAFVLYVGYLDSLIREKFEGNLWSLPAVVYARPLELYPELAISIIELEDELQLAGYRQDRRAEDPGGYDRQEGVIHLVTREFKRNQENILFSLPMTHWQVSPAPTAGRWLTVFALILPESAASTPSSMKTESFFPGRNCRSYWWRASWRWRIIISFAIGVWTPALFCGRCLPTPWLGKPYRVEVPLPSSS